MIPRADLARILQALAFAADKHRDQRRKDEGASPYINHPIALADVLVNEGGVTETTVICAALLHDTIEDTTTDFEDIESRFGTDVAAMVSALTKNMALPEPEREREYDQRLGAADWRVRLVKLADTYDNFADALETEGMDHKLNDHYDKCVRAIELARKDEAAHEASARAVALVRELIAPYRR